MDSQNSSNIYHTSPEEFFQLLHCAASDSTTDIITAYRTLNRVLHQAVNQKTEYSRLRLPGIFAKINHLAKEHSISNDLTQRINDTRVRLQGLFNINFHDERRSTPLATDRERLLALFPYDLKAISEFVASISDTEVPANLRTVFPSAPLKPTSRKSYRNCVRALVNRWDDNYIYVTEDSTEGQERTVCYSADNPYLGKNDWSYLTKLLQPQSQVNLISVREKDNLWLPELIIIEPDILMDVSSVAACMDHYGDSPYTHLLNRLKPSEATEATILGNFASMLLDNALQPTHRQKTYKECATDFFRRNAMQIATSNIGAPFHEEAQRQNEHIRNLIADKEPSTAIFNKDTAIVEPSFFCEALGLQGRMDLIHTDYSLLLEQKSGKGAYPPNPDPDVPNPQSKHYAQMIMYMAILHYGFGQKNSNAYLLYSKYSKGLLGLGPAPTLLFRSIRLRNQLAWLEKNYAETDLLSKLLTSLTPTILNKNNVHGTLWEKYTKPQIESILAPIHQATELERAYYFRMLKFVCTEHLLGKIGTPSRDNSGFASKWHNTLEEKITSGNIYYNMELLSPGADTTDPVETLTLGLSQNESADTSNFRKGDIVVLYAHKKNDTPDVRQTMTFRCSIEDICSSRITVRLRAPQSNAKVFYQQKGNTWTIEHDFYESSSTSLLRSIHSFLSAPQERRDLILAQRPPRIDTNRQLCGDYGERFNSLTLRVKQAQDLFLIVGPPGTGKTSFGMLNTLKEELTCPTSSALLLSYTNRAVDEICSKLIAEDIDFIRIGGTLSCSKECESHLLEHRTGETTNKEKLTQLLTATRVFVGTTSALNAHTEIFKLKNFSLAIVDEASQILEPHIIGLLSAHTNGTPSISKFVLIGDHKQLPAVVQQQEQESNVADTLLRSIGLTDCRNSFFERMYNRYKDNQSVCHTLTHHGRMHEDIALFPNRAFYNDKLQVVPMPHQQEQLPEPSDTSNPIQCILSSHRLAFINAPSPLTSSSDKVNTVEAEIIAQLAVESYRMHESHFNPDHTIGIIVPYRNQIAIIRNSIEKYGIDKLRHISIDTVERFQGSQRKVIIYGFTIRHRHQLNFLCSNTFEEDGALIDRKLNVAMTRAMEHLILVGNTSLLTESPVFRQLIHFAQSRNAYYSALQ